MANIAGTNLATLLLVGAGKPMGAFGQPTCVVADGLNKYAYISCDFTGTAQCTPTSGQGLTGSITVGTTANMLPAGFALVPCTTGSPALVQYAGTTGTTLTGCTVLNGASGTTTGSAITQAPCVYQVQLSNMSLVGTAPVAGIANTQIAPLCFDPVGNQLVLMGTGSLIYTIPITPGTPPTVGVASSANGGATVSGIVYAAVSMFTYDATLGIVWYTASTNKAVFGFYLHDQTGAGNVDYTPVQHACSTFISGYTSGFLGKCGPAINYNCPTYPQRRIALAVPSSVPGVYRWNGNDYNTVCLADDQGAAQSSGTGADSNAYTGPALVAPFGVTYGVNGELYIFPSTLTNLAYVVSNDDPTTIAALNGGSAMTHGSTTMQSNPVYIATNGYTASGQLPQLLYLDSTQLNVCD
jgi:hypothetical protein